ncbi:MAG TPA: hypothetical protein VHG93_06310 [Longimicrobium sp.]|nr:hypothetical protein [Longimicrobium sp.]
MTVGSFADRNLGVNIFPAILRAKGIIVHLHQDHFPQNAADADWMPEVARRGWPIISPDIRISRDRLEVEAIMTSGAAVFCLAGGHLTSEGKARNFLRCLPQILSVLERTPRPFIARVYQPNRDDPADATTRRVDVKLTLADWEKGRG